MDAINISLCDSTSQNDVVTIERSAIGRDRGLSDLVLVAVVRGRGERLSYAHRHGDVPYIGGAFSAIFHLKECLHSFVAWIGKAVVQGQRYDRQESPFALDKSPELKGTNDG